MSSKTSWGVVSTIKASTNDILNFAAYHLDLGAQLVQIYLDEDDPVARAKLREHSKCRVIHTDAGYWKRRKGEKGRPIKHQVRQAANATHCYRKHTDIDWLLHADVDEFVWSTASVSDQLAALPADVMIARVRPIEILADDPSDPPISGSAWCKGCSSVSGTRRNETAAIYPTYGEHLKGGFLSHVFGKIFVRTGQPNVTVNIHRAFQRQEDSLKTEELETIKLAHAHAATWEKWIGHYKYRLEHGSYRDSLRPPLNDGTTLNMNALFSTLEKEGGETALREFYQEVCIATPELRGRLAEHGHLYCVMLDLEAKRAKHFL
ncbi:MAG: glycosyltransferase family 2 protein [Pseudomonadota bacterium]